MKRDAQKFDTKRNVFSSLFLGQLVVDASQVILYDLAPLKESSRRQNGALDTFFLALFCVKTKCPEK